MSESHNKVLREARRLDPGVRAASLRNGSWWVLDADGIWVEWSQFKARFEVEHG